MERFGENSESINPLDIELDEAEGGGYTLLEQAQLTRQLLDEMEDYDTPLDRRVRSSGTSLYKIIQADGKRLSHFLLPNIPGVTGSDLRTIRAENNGIGARYRESSKRIFVPVGQGEMWNVERNLPSYITTTTSECSTLIGLSEDRLIVGHISYSELEELEALIKYFRGENVDFKLAYGVISVGEGQKQHSLNNKRRATLDDYVNLGLLEDNLTQFEFAQEGEELKHMRETIVTPKYIFSYGLNRKRIEGKLIMQGDYYDEKLMAIGENGG